MSDMEQELPTIEEMSGLLDLGGQGYGEVTGQGDMTPEFVRDLRAHHPEGCPCGFIAVCDSWLAQRAENDLKGRTVEQLMNEGMAMKAERDQAQAENEALRAEVERLKKECQWLWSNAWEALPAPYREKLREQAKEAQ